MTKRTSNTSPPLIIFLLSVAIATLILPGLAIGRNAGDSIPIEPAPNLKIDLRQLGYSEIPLVFKGKTTAAAIRMTFGDYAAPRLVFTDKHTLAIVYERLDPEPKQIAFGKDAPQGQPHLKALFVDSTSGRLLWRGDWPTQPLRFIRGRADTQSSIFAVHDGRFLVQADTSLKLYSSNFEILQERGLRFASPGNRSVASSATDNTSFLASAGDTWATLIAPEGRIALLNHIEGTSTTHQWIDVDTLKTVRTSKSDDQFDGLTASETAVADMYGHGITMRSVSGDSRILCDRSQCGYAVPDFLTNDELIASGNLPADNEENKREGFIVLAMNGTVLWSRSEFFSCNNVDGIFLSLIGDRFILSLNRCGSGKMFDGKQIKWRGGEALLVYDRETQKTVFVCQIKLKDWGTFRTALSPDGLTMAVLVGADLSIFNLPPLTKSVP
jgi:hypothetical protein